MSVFSFPSVVPNWIKGEDFDAQSGKAFEKRNPHDGSVLARVAQSNETDIETAVTAAKVAQPLWAEVPGVQRGNVLYEIIDNMKRDRDAIADIVSRETGKSPRDARGETDGAIALGRFFASEGQRLYGRTTTSGVVNKLVSTIREPVGVVGLIAAANTPIANIAWKVFPALVCGNSAVIKSSEDAPLTTWMFGQMIKDTGLPAGVLNIVHGFGEEAGAPLVRHHDVQLISFTGSTAVGIFIARTAGERLAKVSLELGGKNPFVVCDDADIENAVKWAALSAFSNAGQRCASGSRIIVFRSVYDEFVSRFVDATKKLKVGPGDDDDFGPVINEKQLNLMLHAIESARAHGANVLTG
ncbi:MAG: aldehyde dehydrogenase family protein, partial [Parcubacteria group bacterium]